MKQPKKLTWKFKIMLSKHGYDPNDYMFHVETKTSYVFRHKTNGLFVEIDK